MSSWIEPLVEHSDKSRISLRSTADRSRCATVSNLCVRSHAHRGLRRNIRRLREVAHRKPDQKQELVPKRVRQRHRKRQVSERDRKHEKVSTPSRSRKPNLVQKQIRQQRD